MEPLLIGIDVGTTGTRVLVTEADGSVVSEALREYPLSTPRPLWSEQDPAHWWEATVAALGEALDATPGSRERLACIGLTGQMHGLVLLDERGAVLRPAILWNDQRTGAQCEAITERVGRERVLALTGNPVLPGFTAPKIEWVREHEPAVFARVAHVLLPKDYLRYRLTGELHSDVADASGTSLFDVGARTWSSEMLAALDVPRAWMPEVHESPDVCARTLALDACRLPAGVPVVAGAGDQAAQGVGAGILEEGLVSATFGTSGVVFAASDEYRVDPLGRLHAFCHAAPGKWHLMGCVLAAGGSLRWFRDAFCAAEAERAAREGVDPYDALLAEAAQTPPGAEGLLFLPYLTGERTPHPDPLARGAFVGLTLRHARPHLTRAVLEGITYAMRDSLELMRELGITPGEVRASGGGAKSAIWRQLMADVFGCGIVNSSVDHGAAHGAALLAAVGAGAFATVEDAAREGIRWSAPVAPDAAARKAYDASYQRYRALYPALRDSFRAAAADG